MHDASTSVAREPASGAERDEDLATAVAGGGTGARQAEAGAPSQAFALRGKDRCVGGDHDDATSFWCFALTTAASLGKPPADRRAVDGQSFERAEVRQHQRAEHMAIDDARGRADASLPPQAGHPGSGTDGATGERSVDGGRDRFRGMTRRDRHRRRVAEPRVVALADDRRDDVIGDSGNLRERRFDDALVGHADAHGRGQHDRGFQGAPFADRQRAGQLAGTVQYSSAGCHRPLVQRRERVRHDRGDSGAVTGDRRVADAYAVDIGDRVVAASGKRSDLDAALAWARPLLGTRLRHPPSVQRPPTVQAVECYDIAVIGLGGIGSATAWFAARSGQSVVGLERFDLGGHHRGASHDHSRIIRHSYHTEHYVELTRLAYDAWREVESASGKTCVHITGGIDLFPRGAAIDIETYRASMRACDIDFDELTAADVMSRWPAWRLDADTHVLYQADTGIVSPAATVPLLQRLAAESGAVLHGNTAVVGVEPQRDEVRIHLADGGVLRAGQVVIA